MANCCGCSFPNSRGGSFLPKKAYCWIGFAGGHIPNWNATGACCSAKCRFGACLRFGCSDGLCFDFQDVS